MNQYQYQPRVGYSYSWLYMMYTYIQKRRAIEWTGFCSLFRWVFRWVKAPLRVHRFVDNTIPSFFR